MKVLRLLKASSLVAGLAAATCLAQTQPSQVSQSSNQSAKAASTRNANGENSGQAKQATTPVTPSPKKDAASSAKADATANAKPESASADSVSNTAAGSEAAAPTAVPAMSESEALPQGTPFVPDLNLFGPTTAELRQRLATALRNDPALSGSNIEANVSDDTISLTGSVRNAKDRVTARRIAESFATNRKVKEKITVAGSAAIGNSGQSASEINATPAQKNQSATPPTSTGQKPESPNRPVMDPVNAQEKPKSGE